jgi:hypothetical protein
MIHKLKKIGRYTKSFPLIHKALVFLYHFFIFEIYPIIFLKKIKRNNKEDNVFFNNLQKPLIFNIKFEINDLNNLIDLLNSKKIKFDQGGWTIFIKKSKETLKIFPFLSEYPDNVGIKIIKNFNSINDKKYFYEKLKQPPGANFVRKKFHNVFDYFRLWIYLNFLGIMPKVFDLCILNFHNKRSTYAYICESVTSLNKSNVTHNKFIVMLKKLSNSNNFEFSHKLVSSSIDFRSPDCNKNLYLDSNNKPVYVDVQSFLFKTNEPNYFINESIKFGKERLFKKGFESYQTLDKVSGKRDTLLRWQNLNEFLTDHLSLDNKIVYDVGCNTGMMSYYALKNGARYCFGWDRSDVIQSCNSVLNNYGVSRFSGFGGNLETTTNFENDIKSFKFLKYYEGVLFLLSISHHIGFPKSLHRLDWKYLLFEGPVNVSYQENIENLKLNFLKDFQYKVLNYKNYYDGDSPNRTLILVEKK